MDDPYVADYHPSVMEINNDEIDCMRYLGERFASH
jgi:hypothetical protein